MEQNVKYIVSVLGGEKATRMMQEQNKLYFIVSKDSNKILIRKEIESLFEVKTSAINILNKINGDKVAIVQLKKEFSAMDLATKLGLI